jgi:hypothetical protein
MLRRRLGRCPSTIWPWASIADEYELKQCLVEDVKYIVKVGIESYVLRHALNAEIRIKIRFGRILKGLLAPLTRIHNQA